MTPIAGDVCTAVALSVAAASSYVLVLGVYVFGPRCALYFTWFHMRHCVICSCGWLEDTKDANVARSSSTKISSAGVAVCCIRGTCGVRGS